MANYSTAGESTPECKDFLRLQFSWGGSMRSTASVKTTSSMRKWRALSSFLMLLLGLCFSLSSAVTTSTYAKVSSTPPDQLLVNCSISNFTVMTSPKITCGSRCSQNPYCTIYCTLGTECSLFRGRLGSSWSGSGPVQYDECYSIFPMVELGHLGISTSAIKHYEDFDKDRPVFTDFFCGLDATEVTDCYESVLGKVPYWIVDLGVEKKVSSARIGLSDLVNDDIEFRLGNDPDHNKNPLFVKGYSVDPFGAFILSPSKPVVGRYFSVSETSISDIRICDVWIFKA